MMADAAPRRLSVAVPPEHFRVEPGTGAGRVWHSVLPHLRARARVRVAGRLRLRRPDVWLLPAHGRPVERREPVVAMIHGSAWMLEPDTLKLMPEEFAKPFVANTEATLERSSLAIVPSEYTRRGLTEGLGMPEERVAVVPLGADGSAFNPSRRGGRRLVREALGADTPYVLFASIPSIRQKNLVALKEAMARLAVDGLPHALVIAGGTAGGESPEELREIPAGPPELAGRIAWLGHLGDEELAGLMADADAFCLPSLFDAFPLTSLEALACGAPCVFSNRGALPEVAGDAAVVVEPEPDALAEGLERVLTDAALAARLREAGPERAATMTWDRTADGWVRALEQAADVR
jgi:glycosyltransferase involved in cell wall biosynthesis